MPLMYVILPCWLVGLALFGWLLANHFTVYYLYAVCPMCFFCGIKYATDAISDRHSRWRNPDLFDTIISFCCSGYMFRIWYITCEAIQRHLLGEPIIAEEMANNASMWKFLGITCLGAAGGALVFFVKVRVKRRLELRAMRRKAGQDWHNYMACLNRSSFKGPQPGPHGVSE